MEICLYSCEREVILATSESAVVCSRASRNLQEVKASSVDLRKLKCQGIVYGLVGKLQLQPHTEPYILVISRQSVVGRHPLRQDTFVYRIDQVVAVPLSTEKTSLENEKLALSPCQLHHGHHSSTPSGLAFIQKGQRKMLKSTTDFVAHRVPLVKKLQANEEVERRLLEEILRMFNDSGCFYYTSTLDLTNSVQRLQKTGCGTDDRFFWNRQLLKDLTLQPNSGGFPWFIRIIQGFVNIVQQPFVVEDEANETNAKHSVNYSLMLISRRSVHRAGTRYIKRGINDSGNCANYVETEQILSIDNHVLSFVMTRGSVPCFWSQPGYKYRPQPIIDKPKVLSIPAFQRHFEEQRELYGRQVLVNLVDQTGKEKVLSDAYLDHVIEMNSDGVTYVAFDFHDHCRGMKFENVAILLAALSDRIQQLKFCWVDKRREIACEQDGVFRVNCVDCLDRTNVVQTAIARVMLEIQFRKFGLLLPDQFIPRDCQASFQELWASNGDSISRQYAGTAALKGDFTRTGQRNFKGLMKDGYNSASRYYLSHMKDARRQAAIDALLGKQPTTDYDNIRPSEAEDSWLKHKDEELRLLVQDCQRCVVPENEVLLGGWALIDADIDTSDPLQEDMDTVVMLTRSAYYCADYDEDTDKFTAFERVSLEDVEQIEVGLMTTSAVLGVARNKATCMRVNFRFSNDGGYFHVWRSASTRLFNNMAIPIKNEEEADEYVKSIAEQFKVAIELVGFSPHNIVKVGKLERKRSRPLPGRTAQGNRLSSFFNRAGRNIVSGKLFAQSGVSLKKLGNKTANAFQPLFRPAAHKASFHLYVKDAKSEFSNGEHLELKQSMSGMDLHCLTRRVSDNPVSSVDFVIPGVGVVFTSTVGSAVSGLSTFRAQPTKLPLAKRFSHDAEVVFDLTSPTSPPSLSFRSPASIASPEPIQRPPVIRIENGGANELSIEPSAGIFHAHSESVLPDSGASQSDAEGGTDTDSSSHPNTPRAIPNSKSETSLRRLQPTVSPRSEGGEKFLQKLSSSGNRLIGMTTGSFRKIGSQVQNLSGRSGPVATKKPAVPIDNFQQFRDRIATTKSVIILL